MPFIKSKISIPLSKEQETELKTRMGQAIELIPGKSEEYLLLEFEDNCHLWLRGRNDEPIVYIEAAIFGNEPHYGYDSFTAEITHIFSELLHTKPENIYVKYEDITAWGVRGMYIDRNHYR
ncbi:MAG: hypothetical protein IJ711_13310 [Lachnospiraceae bacterium]|nr:hypothetical protein [Lachnospiraceae bacterium]